MSKEEIEHIERLGNLLEQVRVMINEIMDRTPNIYKYNIRDIKRNLHYLALNMRNHMTMLIQNYDDYRTTYFMCENNESV